MPIDRKTVKEVAALARLEVDDARADRLAVEMSEILAYAERLQKLDLSGLEPTVLAPADTPLREDEPNGRRLGNEDALRAAPAAEGGYFLVPPVVENVEP